jgi:hypothetical protein
MVIEKFSLFQIQKEGVSRDTIEFHQSHFGFASKGLDDVYMSAAVGKFIVTMTDKKVLNIANADQPVIATPPVSCVSHFLLRRGHLSP